MCALTFAFARAGHEYDYVPFRTREIQTHSKTNHVQTTISEKVDKSQRTAPQTWSSVRELEQTQTIVNVEIRIEQFCAVQIVVPYLVWVPTSSKWWEKYPGKRPQTVWGEWEENVA